MSELRLISISALPYHQQSFQRVFRKAPWYYTILSSKLLIMLIVLALLAWIVTLPSASKYSLYAKTQTHKLITPQSLIGQTSQTAPKRIIIDKINIDAFVEHVGLDNEKRMDVPKKAANVAWYTIGPIPGEKGNAVIAGHLDDINDTPAVFYDLKNLIPGDEITIVDVNAKRLVFRVSGKNTYDYDNFPLKEVFGPSQRHLLNLITCDGQFNQNTQSYSQRTVVYAELTSDR